MSLNLIDIHAQFENVAEFSDNFDPQYTPLVGPGQISPLVENQLITEHHGVAFREFLKQLSKLSNPFEFTADGAQVLGFSGDLRKIFMGLAGIVIGTHNRGYFYGDLIHRVRISSDFNPTVPFDSYSSDDVDTDVNFGKLCDVFHLRRMVAIILRLSFWTYDVRRYNDLFSDPIKLFFSGVFLYPGYSRFQFFHPIFYNSQDRLRFVDVVQKLAYSNKKIFIENLDLEQPDYNLNTWWDRIPQQSVLSDIFNRRASSAEYKRGNGLPIFIRRVHQHFLNLHLMNSHDEIDGELHQLYPGYCSQILDACIRGFHEGWPILLLQVIITEKPTGFETTGGHEVRCVKRNLLLKAFAKELPSATIRYSSQVVSMMRQMKGVDWMWWSELSGDRWLGFKKPASTGRFSIRGHVDFKYSHGFEPKSMQFLGFGFVPCDDNSVYWFFTWTPSSQEKEREHSQAKMKHFKLSKLGNVPDQIRAFIENSELDSFIPYPIRYRYPWELLCGNISKGIVCVTGMHSTP
ncbi:hypothetical protein SO802_028979 [Lithocarpus litseifolius]|uniref:Uncharacterized protein n=1 Tax=Lithocarpus litseifolius TaxID=425828 RepID=A0AAW2BXG5_9ROSI